MRGERERSRLWNTNIREFLSFQRSFLGRVSDYFASVSDLAATGSVEPGAWIRDYAAFWSGVVEDAGESSLQSARKLRPWKDWLAVVRAKVGEGGRASIRIDIPVEAFGDADDPDAKLTLLTDGLVTQRGRRSLPFPRNVRLVPSVVRRRHRRINLKVFDLEGVVQHGEVYGGLVWSKETERPVAAVEIEIL